MRNLKLSEGKSKTGWMGSREERTQDTPSRSAPSGDLRGQGHARQVTFVLGDSKKLAWICTSPPRPQNAPSCPHSTEQEMSQMRTARREDVLLKQGWTKWFKAE